MAGILGHGRLCTVYCDQFCNRKTASIPRLVKDCPITCHRGRGLLVVFSVSRVQEKKGVASPALDPTRDDDHPNSLDSVPPFGEKGSHVGGGEQGGGVGESRSNGKKYHIIRKKASDAEGIHDTCVYVRTGTVSIYRRNHK